VECLHGLQPSDERSAVPGFGRHGRLCNGRTD
jgi:hypothetical protein